MEPFIVADLLSGYNIVQRIGTGARSQIYQVIHPETGKVFALKRVIRDADEDDRFLQQAITEYEVASRTDHPNLRRAFECKKIKQWLRLREVQVVMELVNGVSLERHRQTEMDMIVRIFMRVCEGLHALHEMGFVHADIKPNNVLVCPDEQVKIIDFGQSCPIGFRKERIQGTADYIAPEQVDRHPLSRQTDVFNLGATLYWVLTGKPFPTRISRKDQDRHDISGPTPRRMIKTPQEINETIPAALSRLVMDCCQDRSTDRPRDMKEVQSRLEVVHHVLEKRREAGEADLTVPDDGEPIELKDRNSREGE